MLGNKRGNLLRDYVADYTVFDLETTGIRPDYDAIIEISAVKVRDGRVADEPELELVFPKFNEFIGEDVLVGHNIHSFEM